MKISILMPTYNDEKYISRSIQSVINQTYKNWELIIVNDGSTDATGDEVKKFEDSRIVYLEQKNADQLNAILTASEHITGDLVMLLHSDDMLAGKTALEINIKPFFEQELDGLFCDLIIMDDNDKQTSQLKVRDKLGNRAPVELLLRLGSNPIPDPFFCTREFFERNVLKNYVKWNIPYWLVHENNRVGVAKLCKSTNPWYCYRVYSGNYVHSDTGKFVAANGCLRSVLLLSRHYFLPFAKIQRRLVRFTRSFVYLPITWKFKKSLVIDTIHGQYGCIPNDPYHTATINFYSSKSKRTHRLKSAIEHEHVMMGKDVRLFYKALKQNNLPPVYMEILEEAQKGLDMVIVQSEKEKEMVELILKFLNIDAGARVYA